MSGWRTISFEIPSVKSEQWAWEHAENPDADTLMGAKLPEDYRPAHKELQSRLLEYDAITLTGREGTSQVYAKHSYAGASPRDILEDTERFWGRAVVIGANDTSDVGDAILYESQPDDGVVQVDNFSEGQCFEEPSCSHTGRRAAAYMLQEHHFEARADFYRWPYTMAATQSQVGSHARDVDWGYAEEAHAYCEDCNIGVTIDCPLSELGTIRCQSCGQVMELEVKDD